MAASAGENGGYLLARSPELLRQGREALLLGGSSWAGAVLQASVLGLRVCSPWLPAFTLTPVSDQEEDEEAEQQDEGHRDPDDVQVPVGTLGRSHTMNEPVTPFN